MKVSKEIKFHFPMVLKDELEKIFDYPITLVEAPIGYGKTTAVREHLKDYRENVLWQNIYSDNQYDFWRSFSHSFKKFGENYESRLLAFGFPDSANSFHKLLEVVEEIVKDKNLVIVLDDFHLIDTPKMSNLLLFLISNEITNLNIILISRFCVNLKRDELSIKGYLKYINKENFKFGPKDIMKYCKSNGINILEREIDKFYNFTEGWISAIYLMLLNYKKTGNWMIFSGIYNLLEEVIYEPLSGEEKNFLLTMSLFRNFTREMSQYLINGSNMILNGIIKKNSFVWFDIHENSYHIHNLFLIFLENKRKELDKNCFLQIYKKASQWYLDERDYLKALEYSYMIKDFNMVFKVLELEKGQVINMDHINEIKVYYRDCPFEIKKKYPYTIVAIALYTYSFNQEEFFYEICYDFMNILNFYKNIDDTLYKNLLGEYEVLLSYKAYNNIEEMGIHLEKATKLLDSPSKAFQSNQPYTFGCPSLLFLYYRKSGELDKITNDMKSYYKFHRSISDSHGRGAYEIMMAEKYYYTGEFENSEIYLHKVYHMNINKKTGILLCNLYLNAKLSIVKGNLAEATKFLDRARELYENDNWVFGYTIDIYEAYFYASIGIFSKIKPWVLGGEIENANVYYPTLSYLNVIYGRVLIEKKEYIKFIGISEYLLSKVSYFPNIIGQINIYICSAIAHHNISTERQALDYLEKALDLSLEDSICMPFVENGSNILVLLRKLGAIEKYRKHVDKIFDLHKKYAKAKENIHSQMFPNKKLTLTKREREVAEIAAQGLSNKEIAKKLFISENTVKTQLKNIYSKLNINSRALLVHVIKSE